HSALRLGTLAHRERDPASVLQPGPRLRLLRRNASASRLRKGLLDRPWPAKRRAERPLRRGDGLADHARNNARGRTVRDERLVMRADGVILASGSAHSRRAARDGVCVRDPIDIERLRAWQFDRRPPDALVLVRHERLGWARAGLVPPAQGALTDS